MELDRARAIADVAQVVVESAKVEVKFMEVTGNDGSGFIPRDQLSPGPTQPRLLNGTQR